MLGHEFSSYCTSAVVRLFICTVSCIKILNTSEEKESAEKIHVRVIKQQMKIVKKDEKMQNQQTFVENSYIIIVEKYNKLIIHSKLIHSNPQSPQ